MFGKIKETLVSEKEFTETYYERFEKYLVYIESNLIDSDGVMYKIVDSLIEINNVITS